uniref:Cytochrome c oxidase subunit 2 n=1 Tax=Coleochaete scutata TaxID=3125 RepID=A0A6G9IG39_COLSC|nr:cytochrome c oxidase subunit 2 [Coleochaete scutata]
MTFIMIFSFVRQCAYILPQSSPSTQCCLTTALKHPCRMTPEREIVILIFVVWMLVRTLWYFHSSRNPIPERIVHGTTIEIIWTIFPSIILMFIAIPSFALLYSMDEVVDPAITIKAIGFLLGGQKLYILNKRKHTIALERRNGQKIVHGSLLKTPLESLVNIGSTSFIRSRQSSSCPSQYSSTYAYNFCRRTSGDRATTYKMDCHLPSAESSTLYSWAVPSLGVKCDAVPGRLNQVSLFIKREGVFYGQCSELCGTNHAFMPIVVEAVPLEDYISWVSNKYD